jgi:hypothetical protein
MNIHQNELAQQLSDLLTQLQQEEQKGGELSTRMGICTRLCVDHLRLLRQSITTQGFPDPATEIYFFKHVKPVIAGRYTYYCRAQQLQNGAFNVWSQEKERLAKELDKIGQFFGHHAHLWSYYRSGSTAYDEQYFLRGKDDWLQHASASGFDDLFSTSFDGQLAELHAMDLLMQHIDQQLSVAGDPASVNNRRHPNSPLRCIASVTEVVELAYALHASGFFASTCSIKDVIEGMADAFQVNVPNCYLIFAQIRTRKTNITRFLDKLRSALEYYIKHLET